MRPGALRTGLSPRHVAAVEPERQGRSVVFTMETLDRVAAPTGARRIEFSGRNIQNFVFPSITRLVKMQSDRNDGGCGLTSKSGRFLYTEAKPSARPSARARCILRVGACRRPR